MENFWAILLYLCKSNTVDDGMVHLGLSKRTSRTKPRKENGWVDDCQLLQQSALHCLETTALLKFEWLEGVLKLPRNLYAFNLGLLGQNPQNPEIVWPNLEFPKSTPKGNIQTLTILWCLLQRYDLKPHHRCSKNYETLYLVSLSKTLKGFWLV